MVYSSFRPGSNTQTVSKPLSRLSLTSRVTCDYFGSVKPHHLYMHFTGYRQLSTLQTYSPLSLSLYLCPFMSVSLCSLRRFVQCSGPAASVRSLPQSAVSPVRPASARRSWRASLAVGTVSGAMAISTRQTPTRVRCVALICGPTWITRAAFQSPLLSWSGALRGQSSLCLLQSLASWPPCLWWSRSFATTTLPLWKHRAESWATCC